MKAPDSFYIYGYCKGLYKGPRKNGVKNPIELESNPIKIRYYEFSIYNSVEITQAVLVDEIDKKTLLKQNPKGFSVGFSCDTAIYFKEIVFDEIHFIRDQITDSFFLDPKISETVKKGKIDFTYGSIEGWGYFKVGNIKKTLNAPVVTKPIGIKQPNFSISAIGTDPTYYHENNGSIYTEPKWGLGPYLFSIDDGLNYQSNSTFNSLPNGDYIIKAKDSNGNIAYSNPISLYKKNNAGCLPPVLSGFSLFLIPVFGISFFWGIPLFLLFFFLFKFLFGRFSFFTRSDSYLTANTIGLGRTGCTWPLILILLFSALLFRFCTQVFNPSTQNTILTDEKKDKQVHVDVRPLEKIPPVTLNYKEENELKTANNVDSIFINNELTPLKYSKDFYLIICDNPETVSGEDALMIRLNGKEIMSNNLISEIPIEIKLTNFNSGKNYIDIIPTSNGLSRACTPKILITYKGKIIFEELIYSDTKIISRLTFINNL